MWRTSWSVTCDTSHSTAATETCITSCWPASSRLWHWWNQLVRYYYTHTNTQSLVHNPLWLLSYNLLTLFAFHPLSFLMPFLAINKFTVSSLFSSLKTCTLILSFFLPPFLYLLSQNRWSCWVPLSVPSSSHCSYRSLAAPDVCRASGNGPLRKRNICPFLQTQSVITTAASRTARKSSARWDYWMTDVQLFWKHNNLFTNFNLNNKLIMCY